MRFDWKNWNIGGKMIFVAACVAVFSMLLKWVDVGFASQSGLSQHAFLLLVLWIYPVTMLLKDKPIHFVCGQLCSVFSFVFTLVYIASKSIEVFDTTVNVAGTGAYLFLFASLALIAGIGKYQPVISEEDEVQGASKKLPDSAKYQPAISEEETGETQGTSERLSDSPKQGGVMDEVIPIPVILAFAAILILLGSFAWVTYRDSRGSGIDQHDSLTPQHTTRLWEAVEANQ